MGDAYGTPLHEDGVDLDGWVPRFVNPPRNGWYAVERFNGTLSVRLYEDGTWFYLDTSDSEQCLRENTSFLRWHKLPKPEANNA